MRVIQGFLLIARQAAHLERLREQFRKYCGLVKIARCGFPWEETTNRPIASV
jgi:hypothetical protein